MIKTQLKRNAGNKLYSIVGWFCYIACTIISAILNIYLLSKLDKSWAWFLLTMSLSLEFGKAYILIRANTYRSLAEYLKNCKFKASKVITKEKLFYGIYILFAILSITASLCFSLTITDKTEQGYTLQKQQVSQNLETVSNSQIKYEEALEKFTMLQDNSDDAVKEARNDLRKATEAFEDAGIKLDNKAKELCEAAEDNPNNWTRYRKGNPEYDVFRDQIDYEKLRREMEYAQEDYNDVLSGKALERAKKAYEAAEAEFNEKVKLYGSTETLKLSLSTIEKQELEAAGSSKCFILLANTFGIPDKVKTIKFVILLYVSLLVELCIWLSSPDLRLDGGLLYSYRNDLGLSTKKDVDKLLKEIKDTNIRFSSKEEEVKIVEKVPERIHKEMDNLKEQIEILTREKEEGFAISNDEANKYKEQIEALNNKINFWEEENDKNTEALEDYKNKINLAVDNYTKFENASNDKIEGLMHENDLLKEKLQENPDDVALEEEYKDQINILAEKNLKLEEEKNDKDAKLKETENSLDELNKKLTDANTKISTLNDQLVESSANDNNKYTEDDIKEVVKKTADKSKKTIKSLKEQVSNWEEMYRKVKVENDNLKLANFSLENNNKELILKNDTLLEKNLANEKAEEEKPKKKKLSEIKLGTLEEEAKELLK